MSTIRLDNPIFIISWLIKIWADSFYVHFNWKFRSQSIFFCFWFICLFVCLNYTICNHSFFYTHCFPNPTIQKRFRVFFCFDTQKKSSSGPVEGNLLCFSIFHTKWSKNKINIPYPNIYKKKLPICSKKKFSVLIQWKHFYLIGSHPLPGVQWIDSNYTRFTLSTCTTNVGLASSAHHNNPDDNQHTSNTAPTSNSAVSSNHTQIQYGSAYTSGQMIASNKNTNSSIIRPYYCSFSWFFRSERLFHCGVDFFFRMANCWNGTLSIIISKVFQFYKNNKNKILLSGSFYVIAQNFSPFHWEFHTLTHTHMCARM